MLSNLLSQLTEQGLQDKYEEVLAEVPKVRADLGFPPLVTPLSQMVGTQALMNVISGERYKLVPTEIKDYVRGLYGRPPAPIKTKIQEKIIGTEASDHRTTSRFDSTAAPGIRARNQRICQNGRRCTDVCTFPSSSKKISWEDEKIRFYDVAIQTVDVTIAIP